MRLGPEHRPHLVDTFEDADHQLLVELRRLGQVRGPAEPVQREHVRPALGAGADHLRRVDLHEVLGVECGPEPGHRGRRDPQRGRPGGVPQRDGRVVELGGQARGERRPVQVERWRYGGRPEGRTVGSVSSTPAGAVPFAVAVAVTSTTVSSVSFSSSARTAGSVTTTWVRPVASRTIRKATDLSSRRRCTQPAIRTVVPILAGSWWDRVRCMACCSSVDRHAVAALGWRKRRISPREVWASGNLAVPPHLRPRRSGGLVRRLLTGASRAGSTGRGGTAAVLPAAREGLRAPVPDRLSAPAALCTGGSGRYSAPSSLLAATVAPDSPVCDALFRPAGVRRHNVRGVTPVA